MNKQVLNAMLSGLLLCAATAMAQTPQGGVATGFSAANITQPTPTNAVQILLAKPVESVDWVENTFEEVLDWLREQGGLKINVIARMNQLKGVGVTLDTPVTLKLYNTTVAEVLDEALLQMSDGDQLTFHGFGNKLIISTRSDFDSKMYTRVYDVTDLLLRVPDFGETAPAIDLQNAQQTSGGGGSAQSVFQGGNSGQEQTRGGQQAERETEKRLKKFRELIEQSIEPKSWDLTGSSAAAVAGAGGGRGRIRVLGNSLIITNTIEVHEKIAGAFRFKRRG